ncbi:MAG: SDR family NAD(P)-dependent oxidoreductase [Sandaracinaceae bacterium]|nr:SDR family NAD(P)-dependent oxidoreductase [Sandaracinaceae bacterium]
MGALDGRVAWITGAGSGIGRALALELARRGAVIAVSGRRVANLEEVAKDIERVGGRALPVACDVTEEEDVARAVAQVVRELGQLDICVANAGFSVMGSIAKLSAEDWRRQLDTNVIGAVITAKHALPHLEKTKGRVAFVASVSAFVPAPGLGAYNASKAALRAIGLTLAAELHGTGVSATLLHPGFVESEIAQVDNKGHFDPARADKRPKNLMWKAEDAARVMADAIWARKRELVFTGHGKVGAFVGQHAPGLLHLALTRGPGAKQAKGLAESKE